MTGDGLSDRELSDYAELVKREVNELEGVDRVELYGKRSECINISLLQDRMANLGVKPAEVLATLNGQNKTTYTGYYENGENRDAFPAEVSNVAYLNWQFLFDVPISI